MAILTNGESVSEHGLSQQKLMEHITHIEAALVALSTKLDDDAGITSTDYAAALEQIIVQTAIPPIDRITVTEIIAEYDA